MNPTIPDRYVERFPSETAWAYRQADCRPDYTVVRACELVTGDGCRLIASPMFPVPFDLATVPCMVVAAWDCGHHMHLAVTTRAQAISGVLDAFGLPYPIEPADVHLFAYPHDYPVLRR